MLSVFVLNDKLNSNISKIKNNIVSCEVYLQSNSGAYTVKSVNPNFAIFNFSKKGEAYELKDIGLDELLKKYSGNVEYYENVNGIENYYLYDENIAYCQQVNGKKINIHISRTKEKIKIGFPIIYGSY